MFLSWRPLLIIHDEYDLCHHNHLHIHDDDEDQDGNQDDDHDDDNDDDYDDNHNNHDEDDDRDDYLVDDHDDTMCTTTMTAITTMTRTLSNMGDIVSFFKNTGTKLLP